MKIFGAYVSPVTQMFFQDHLANNISLEAANSLLKDVSGIVCFFETQVELQELKELIFLHDNLAEEHDRSEYGDFQTNLELAISITKYLLSYIGEPEVIIEPTCGKGNFIIAALKTFTSLKKIYGIEIYKPYVWQTRFSTVDFFLNNSSINKPEIIINHCNVFDFNFDSIASEVSGQKILIIGNPPWVTNSMLGSLDSYNLPAKSNFKKHNGLDAITGKGNFDIAEYITLMMIKTFQNQEGNLALLVKNSVIKNIIYDQKNNKYKIGNLKRYGIDSKKEFNVSVNASLLFCQFNIHPSYECREFDFYQTAEPLSNFGWIDEKFVSNIENYAQSKDIDGICAFEWRQGLKHDCSAVMELDKENEYYVNALNEKVYLEENLVYGILKSSDLKTIVVKVPRKYVIVTQKKVGQDTSYIRDYPNIYQYLLKHQNFFNARKSSIYKDKPSFSIFGIGDYSFKPFKVVVSGLYKTFHFTLVLPENQKPLMLDDTCYMLGFDTLNYAVYTLILLNSSATRALLQSITFVDAKRQFTKDVLMRVDLYKLSEHISYNELELELENLNKQYDLGVSYDSWNSFIDQLKPVQSGQMKMFA